MITMKKKYGRYMKIKTKESKYITTKIIILYRNIARWDKRNKRTMKQTEKKMNKIAIVNPYLSIITSHVNGFNPPVKIYRLAECIKKEDSTICCLQKIHVRYQDTLQLKSEGVEKDIP